MIGAMPTVDRPWRTWTRVWAGAGNVALRAASPRSVRATALTISGAAGAPVRVPSKRFAKRAITSSRLRARPSAAKKTRRFGAAASGRTSAAGAAPFVPWACRKRVAPWGPRKCAM